MERQAASFGADDIETLERILTARHSCRAYLDTQVPRAVIEDIVTAAQHSASWCNSQAWHLTITEGEGTTRFRQALSAHAAQQMGDAALPQPVPDIPMPLRYDGIYGERRRACGFALYNSLGIARGDRAGSARAMLQNFSFFGAPHTAIVTTPKDLGTYGAIDCGLFLSTFLTVATAHGLGTIAQGALAVYSTFVRDYFSIADDRHVLFGISFGYPDLAHPANQFRTERAPVQDVVDWRTD